MTIQPIEALDLLAGLEEHRGCEHSGHGQNENHADGGEQFVKVYCHCKGPVVRVFCNRILIVAFSHRHMIRCLDCGERSTPEEVWVVLGPAND